MPELQQAAGVKKKRKKVDVRWLDEHMPTYAKKIKEKTGLTVLDPKGGVGCGTYGCVYLTDDPRWVVKGTSDDDEGPLAQRIVEIRKEIGGGDGYGPSRALPGIVFYKHIFQARPIEHAKKFFKPYILIRENIRPVTDEDVDKMTWYIDGSLPNSADDARDKKKHRHARDISHPGLELAMLWAQVFHKNDPKTIDKAMDKYVGTLNMIKKEFPLIVEDMFYLMGEEHNLVLQDVHAFNVGYSLVDWGPKYRRPGSIVIHDLGMTPTTPKSRFRMLNPLHIVEC